MHTPAAAALVFAISLLAASAAHAQQILFIVRHAEKVDDSKDPELSAAGQARAARLAALLGDAGITAVYSTAFKRTQNTAKPLADALGVPVTTGDTNAGALAADVRAKHATGRILIVGHSNTVPELLAAFGHPDRITIADDEYSSLFVVTPRAEGPPVVVRLRY